jgi:2-phospho-L-lactate guanylyltransferase (CobY/MobA/RfbA family)
MAAVVVPYRGPGGKSRLAVEPQAARARLLQAMLRDVLDAAGEIAPTVVADGPGGQGAAVAAALVDLAEGPILVVNADLPCATAADLRTLLGSIPGDGIALVEATDGTTNALGLSSPRQFAPLYGPGSAERFRAHAKRLRVSCVAVDLPNLVDDVDTLADLERLGERLGRRTRAALDDLRAGAAA